MTHVARVRAAAAAVAAASLLAAAVPAHAEEPASRYPATSARWKLVAGGLGVTAASYGIGAACAAAWPEVPGSEALYIPVAGPWIALGQSGCAEDDAGCGAILGVRGVLLVLSGLIQGGGLAVAGEGLFMTTEAPAASTGATTLGPRATSARAASLPSAPRGQAATVTVMPVPLVTERSTGLGVVGLF
jgi:hypothetical protein